MNIQTIQPNSTHNEAPATVKRWQFTDLTALGLVALAYLALLSLTWQRWTQPLLDHGREMNLPARLLAGERLYQDVQFLYGPLAPHLNAALYWLFSPRLGILHTVGALCGWLLLWLVYRLARKLMTVPQAFATTMLVLVLCVLKSTGNVVQPYAYAALYGLLLAYGALWCAIRFNEGAQPRYLRYGAALAVLALFTKLEFAIPAVGALGVAWWLHAQTQARWPWRNLGEMLSIFFGLGVALSAFTLRHTTLTRLLDDNHVLFSNMPPQLIFFNQHISGLAQWPRSLWFTLAGLGMLSLWFGASVLFGALLTRTAPGWPAFAWRGLCLTLLGAAWVTLFTKALGGDSGTTPFAAAIIVLPLMFWLYWQQWKKHQPGTARSSNAALLILIVFAVGCGLRSALRVTATGPYTPFFLPATIIVFLYLLFVALPQWLVQAEQIRQRTRQVAVTLVCLIALGTGINSALRLRRLQSYQVASARGQILVEPNYGEPLDAALRYIEQHTQPTDEVLSLPIGTTLNFLAARRYPFFPEIVHPGFVAGSAEQAVIADLAQRRAPLILLANLDTSEFRDRSFGIDYNVDLFNWIKQHYQLAARFDSALSQGAAWGDKPFFILAYELKK